MNRLGSRKLASLCFRRTGLELTSPYVVFRSEQEQAKHFNVSKPLLPDLLVINVVILHRLLSDFHSQERYLTPCSHIAKCTPLSFSRKW